MSDRVVRYILSGDSRGAVRAMQETAAASEATGAKVQASGTKVAGAMAATEKGVKKTHGAISGFVGTAGLLGVAFGLKDVIHAGIGYQAQQAQLQLALGKSRDRLEEVNKALDESSTHGGFAAPEEQQAFTAFLRLTGDVNKALKLNAEAVEFARGRNIDLATAVQLVSQVQTGNLGRLQRYLGIQIPVHKSAEKLTAAYNNQLIAIRSSTKGNKGLQDVMVANAKKNYQTALAQAQTQDKNANAAAGNAAILKKYGGATEAYSKTTAGALSNTNNSYHLLAVTLGKELNPVVSTLANFFAKNPKLVLGVTAALAGLYGATKLVEGVTKGAAAAQKLMNLFTGRAVAPTVALTTANEGLAASEAEVAAAGEAAGVGGAAGAAGAAGRASRLGRFGMVAGLATPAAGVIAASMIAQGAGVPNADPLLFLHPQSTGGKGDMINQPGTHYDPAANGGRGGRVAGPLPPKTPAQAIQVHTHIKIGSREVAEAVTHHILQMQSRK